jgi:hypothetical protein
MKLHEYEMLPELAFTPRGGRFGRGMTLWGKGGGASAPPPIDPSITSNLANNIALGGQLATSGLNTYNSTTAPAIQNAINTQTAANNTYSTAANTAANQQLGIYNNTAVPALQAIQADANNYNNAGYQEQIASQALGDVNQQFAQQQANNALRQQSYGINPNSGAAQMSGNANAVQQAEAGAAASTQARAAAVALGLQKQQNVFNLANPSLSNAASLGTAAIGATQNNVTNALAMGTSNNAALNTAGGLLSSANTAANSAYGNQVSAYNATQQANATTSAGLFSGLGTGIGAYAALA